MRLSFLGGTTDFQGYFDSNVIPGRVLGTTINQYVYVTILEQPKFEKIKYRFSWRFTESVSAISDISHPVLRTVLEKEDWQNPLNISTMATLPGRSGMGSSSAFTVSLLAAISQLKGIEGITATELAQGAISVERFDLGEPGGYQDQYHAAVGGFRRYVFSRDGVEWSPPVRDFEFRSYLSECLVLVATGGGRDSGVHAARTTMNIDSRKLDNYLSELSNLTEQTFEGITSASNSEQAVKLLASSMNEGWKLKKSISSHSSSLVDDLIEFGISKGALAGKLCGAGGSGFAAFIVNPRKMPAFKNHFDKNEIVDIRIVDQGQEIILK